MNARYEGKIVVVTGAGNGIGREYAAGFAREGAQVALADIDLAAAEAAAKELGSDGTSAIGVHVDVGDEASVVALMARVVDELRRRRCRREQRRVCTWVASTRRRRLPVAEWRRILDVNVVGAMLCAREARASMAARGGGVVLNQSSMASYLSAGGAYGVSKLALNGLTIVAGCRARRRTAPASSASRRAWSGATRCSPTSRPSTRTS